MSGTGCEKQDKM